MYWITQICKSIGFDDTNWQQDYSSTARSLRKISGWIYGRYQYLLLVETIRKERAALAKMSDEQLRDMGLHRADADRESQRDYLDIPENRR